MCQVCVISHSCHNKALCTGCMRVKKSGAINKSLALFYSVTSVDTDPMDIFMVYVGVELDLLFLQQTFADLCSTDLLLTESTRSPTAIFPSLARGEPGDILLIYTPLSSCKPGSEITQSIINHLYIECLNSKFRI